MLYNRKFAIATIVMLLTVAGAVVYFYHYKIIDNSIYKSIDTSSFYKEARDLNGYFFEASQLEAKIDVSTLDWTPVVTIGLDGLDPKISLSEKLEPLRDPSLRSSGGRPPQGYFLIDDEGNNIDTKEKFFDLFLPITSQEEAVSFAHVLGENNDEASEVYVSKVSDGYFVWTLDDISEVSWTEQDCGITKRIPLGSLYFVDENGEVLFVGFKYTEITRETAPKSKACQIIY